MLRVKKTGYDQFFKQAREKADSRAHAETLRRQLIARRKKAKSKKKFPFVLVLSSLFCFSLAGLVAFDYESFEPYFTKIEVKLFGQAAAEEKTAAKNSDKSTADSAVDAKKSEDSQSKEALAAKEQAADANKKNYTEEELNHFARLNERKRELDAREEELNRMEAELNKQKIDIEKRMESIESARKNISEVLDDKVKVDDKKVETLVQLYSNMKPPQAAKIFEEMDEDLAVEIFGRMKKKNAAEIMNLIKPEKAKLFTEKFAGYRRDKP